MGLWRRLLLVMKVLRCTVLQLLLPGLFLLLLRLLTVKSSLRFSLGTFMFINVLANCYRFGRNMRRAGLGYCFLQLTGNGKVRPNLDQESTRSLNLKVLQRVDPFVKEILITAFHVTLREFDVVTSQWSRKDVEGSLFVVKRTA